MKVSRFSFVPGQPAILGRDVPPAVTSLRSYIKTLERRIKSALEAKSGYSSQEYLSAEPEKYKAGDFVLADGVKWNPGSGEGLYRRNFANSAWVFIG